MKIKKIFFSILFLLSINFYSINTYASDRNTLHYGDLIILYTDSNSSHERIIEKALYTTQTKNVSLDTGVKTFEYFKNYNATSKKEIDKILEELRIRWTYDDEKRDLVVKEKWKRYVVDIDYAFADKKGLCIDFAAVVAGVLRNKGVPTKLVMGYEKNIEAYHAWNEYLFEGKWYVFDMTFAVCYQNLSSGYNLPSNYTIKEVY